MLSLKRNIHYLLPEEFLELAEGFAVPVGHDGAVDGGPQVGWDGGDVGQVVGEAAPVKFFYDILGLPKNLRLTLGGRILTSFTRRGAVSQSVKGPELCPSKRCN